MSDQTTLIVKCPSCGKPAEFSQQNPNRPFCSERCQTLDLGAWAVERYKLPVSELETSTVNEKSPDEERFDGSISSKHH